MRFADLPLHPSVLENIAKEGYETATPIQAGAIPHVLDGRDVLGIAQTGTGKTAAFALPVIHRLMDQAPPAGEGKKSKHRPNPSCLILCPTRELVTQIADAFKTYAAGSGLRGVTIFGGVNQNGQVRRLREGVDVILATPGRLLDLLNQGHVDLSAIQTLVLDEADRMLDMGFIHDLRRIIGELPDQKQTLLFSATLPLSIVKLADGLLQNPATVKIEAAAPTADRVEQSVYFVDKKDKSDLLADLITDHGMFRTIVFTRTKHGADKLGKKLRAREIKSEIIHGNKTQNARQRALDNFKADRVAVLVATDVAARGIDVDSVSHVINFDLTHEPETYVHRIGRTARAGAEGIAISFCDNEEVAWLRDIEQLLGTSIQVVGDTPEWANLPAKAPRGPRGGKGGGRGGKRPHRKGQNHVKHRAKNHGPAGKAGKGGPRPGRRRAKPA